jgi:hypothetical protein
MFSNKKFYNSLQRISIWSRRQSHAIFVVINLLNVTLAGVRSVHLIVVDMRSARHQELNGVLQPSRLGLSIHKFGGIKAQITTDIRFSNNSFSGSVNFSV